MKRNNDIDFIKGVAIFLMVFAHAATYWTLLYTFAGIVFPLVVVFIYRHLIREYIHLDVLKKIRGN